MTGGILDDVIPLADVRRLDEEDRQILAAGLRSCHTSACDALASRIVAIERYPRLADWKAYCGEVWLRIERIERIADDLGYPIGSGRRSDLATFARRTQALGRPPAHTGEYPEADRIAAERRFAEISGSF